MVEQNQHQSKLRNAMKQAEQAVQAAGRAEIALQEAQRTADPEQLQKAQRQYRQTAKQVAQAEERVVAEANDQQKQQTRGMLDELKLAQQTLADTEEDAEQPRQVR